jgi:hypothetical protein
MGFAGGTRVIAVFALAAAAWVALTPGYDAPGVAADDVDRTSLLSLRARIVAKAVVARELFAGRLSLPEATAVFAWVNRQRSDVDAEHPAPPGTGTDDAPAVLEWSWSSVGGTQTDPTILEATPLLAEQIEAASPAGPSSGPPAVNEADCRELLDRSAAAVRADRGRLLDHIETGDLRLVRRPPN